MRSAFKKEDFVCSAETVAFFVLGSNIISRKGEKFKINEVELYEGFQDDASHAFRGMTKRNAPMFEEGGVFYIYLIYGMHFMINIVTGKKDHPSAILLRGAGNVSGPGRLAKALNFNMSFNYRSVLPWMEYKKGDRIIERLPRVGVDYAKCKDKPLRFKLK